jgi:hypothetical protein
VHGNTIKLDIIYAVNLCCGPIYLYCRYIINFIKTFYTIFAKNPYVALFATKFTMNLFVNEIVNIFCIYRNSVAYTVGSSDFWLFLDFDYTSYRFEKLNKI